MIKFRGIDLTTTSKIEIKQPNIPEEYFDTVGEEQYSALARGRGKETLFRVIFRNQINLTSIADKKAAMIISLNSILITLIIALFGSGLSVLGIPAIDNLELVVPFTILLITCLISAIFAIMAAKPNIIKPPDGRSPKISILFFGNFFNKTLDEYLKDMSSLLKSKSDIYEHLSIDLYHQGIVLHRKYSYLRVAYTLFMVGITLSVISYLAIWLFNLV